MSVGILSKGIEFAYSATGTGAFTKVPDLQEIPDLGGETETVEVTTLDDGTKRYIQGLKEFSDLEFTFLYDNSGATSSYRIMRGLEDGGKVNHFKVTLPDKTVFAFSGSVSTTLSGTGVGDALIFTAKVTPNSDITVTNPSA